MAPGGSEETLHVVMDGDMASREGVDSSSSESSDSASEAWEHLSQARLGHERLCDTQRQDRSERADDVVHLEVRRESHEKKVSEGYAPSDVASDRGYGELPQVTSLHF